MIVSYNRLFKLLIDKGLKKMEFDKQVGIGQNIVIKFKKMSFYQ